MRIALATALALILATPALANENAALFLAEHAAAQAETAAPEAVETAADAAPAPATYAPASAQAFFLAEAARAQAEATETGTAQPATDEAPETAAAPAPAAASHPAKAFFLADAEARADDAPAATATVVETAAAAAPAAAGGSVQAMVTAAALRHGIDPTLAHAMAMVESNYRCSAVGRAGELGVMQVKPATARSVGVTGNLRDCATGIEAGMRYLRASIDRHGAGCGGISAYNMGIHRKASFCNGYGRKVMARMSRVQLASLD
ncbi:lytic transglycosylase domain-containing protein [Salinarimonas rosea]|uniref:lytic transglycosylase domain-containing protein n=1 Tax=Salinarimonas rosea TaxID=552063 RepID=UPI00042206FA|nr:transglycosylase SLT domain-containing protein [Salinarimonas rosea]